MSAQTNHAAAVAIDRDLVARASKGDQRAFTELVRRHTQRAMALAVTIVRNEADARDVVQEAFVRVWRHLADFTGAAAFSTWLYQIVRNLSIDHHRRSDAKRRADVRVDDDGGDDPIALLPDASPSPEDVAAARQAVTRVGVVMATLSPAHREALAAHAEGLSHRDAAARHGVPVGTALTRAWYARKALAAAMECSAATVTETKSEGGERTAPQPAYQHAEGDDMDISKKTCNIDQCLKGTPALTDPTKDLKIVANGKAGGLFVEPTDATRDLVDPDAPDGAELRALYADPDKFFASEHPRAAHHFNMVTSVFTKGQQTEPRVVRGDGDAQWYVKFGRSRLVWWAIAWECLAGTRVVKAISGHVAKARADLGLNWRPDFRVMNGGRTDEETASEILFENTGRKVIGLRGRYANACQKIAAWERAHKNAPKAPPPPYAEIAVDGNVSEATVKGWERLSRLSPAVIEHVLSERIPLSSVLVHVKKGVSNAEVEALVNEQIEKGATTVRDSLATRRAMVNGDEGYVSESTVDNPPDGDGATAAPRTQSDEAREPRESADAATTGGGPKPVIALKAWGKREFSKFLGSLEGADAKHLQLAFIAGVKIATEGPASLTPDERESVRGLDAYIKKAKRDLAKRLRSPDDAE